MGAVGLAPSLGGAPYEVGYIKLVQTDAGWHPFECPIKVEKVTRIIGYGIADKMWSSRRIFFAVDDTLCIYHTGSDGTFKSKEEVIFKRERGRTDNKLHLGPAASFIEKTFTLAFIYEEGKTPLQFPHY